MNYSQIDVPTIQAQARLQAAIASEERAFALETEAERVGDDALKTTAAGLRKVANGKARQVNLKPIDKRQVRTQFLERWIGQLEERHLRVTTAQEDDDDAALLPDGTSVPKAAFDSYLEQVEEAIAFGRSKLDGLTPKKRTARKSPAARKPRPRK